jgi:hypothetical protein
MQLIKTNKKSGKTLLVTLFDIYSQYVSFGYPKDPKVYFIKANKETLALVKEAVEYLEVAGEPVKFSFERADWLKTNDVEFGPETFIIKWDGVL